MVAALSRNRRCAVDASIRLLLTSASSGHLAARPIGICESRRSDAFMSQITDVHLRDVSVVDRSNGFLMTCIGSFDRDKGFLNKHGVSFFIFIFI